MGRYDALRDYLQRQGASEVELGFDEINRLIAPFQLPLSAGRPHWWRNERDPEASHSRRNAWRAAGYDAVLVSGARRVRFRKVDPPS